MGTRKERVEELVLQALSETLHSRWRTESVGITLTGVRLSDDLKNARVFFTVFGGRTQASRAAKFLLSIRSELRRRLGGEVVLKYTPSIEFEYDISIERQERVLSILDEMQEHDNSSSHDAGEASSEDAEGGSGKPEEQAAPRRRTQRERDSLKYKRRRFDFRDSQDE